MEKIHTTPIMNRSFLRATVLAFVSVTSGCMMQVEDAPSESDEAIGSVQQATAVEVVNGFAGITVLGRTSTPDLTPDAPRSYNSAGLSNRNVYTGVGTTRMEFPGLGGTGGIAHVTSFLFGDARCKVESMAKVTVGASRVDEHVKVRCHDETGTLLDTPFVASYSRPTGSELAATVHANQPTTANYTPNNASNWNWSGVKNSVARSSTGAYVVTMPGVASAIDGGNVMVTAYGTDTSYCKVGGWLSFGSSVLSTVYCFKPNGAPADSQFMLSYTNESSFTTWGDGSYVWAGSPTSASYTPQTMYSWGSNAEDPTIVRRAKGQYDVNYGDQPGKHVAHTTAYGSGSEYCITDPLYTATDGIHARVECFTHDGKLTDAMFTQRLLVNPW